MIITQNLTIMSKENVFGMTDHATTIDVDPSWAWPDSIRTALLWLAATAKKRRIFNSKAAAITFQHYLQQPDVDGCMLAIDSFSLELDKDGDKWRILKTVTASPKAIGLEPPNSVCPRCNRQVWKGEKKPDRTSEFKRNPYPLYCLNCGQRYKYDDGALSYTSDIDTQKWADRLANEETTVQQPDLGTVA